MKKKYLLTGVAGFIGSQVGKMLLASGNEVVGIDNMNDYYDVRLKEHRLSKLKDNEGFEFHKVDIENLESLRQLFEKHRFSGIINLAARAGVRYSMVNPHVYMTTNAQGTLNLLELMKEFEVKKMVLASTSSLYAGQKMPFCETLAVNQPISPYAASKKSAEAMCYAYHHLHNIDISIVRYFTVFGPAGRPDMSIFRFIKWIDKGVPIELFGDGSQSRDFTYVEDIARGTIAALKPVGYEVINLGGGRNPISLNTVINLIETHLGKKAQIKYMPFHKADMTETWAEIGKAKELLGWTPQIGFEEGLLKTIDWYREEQSLADMIDCSYEG